MEEIETSQHLVEAVKNLYKIREEQLKVETSTPVTSQRQKDTTVMFNVTAFQNISGTDTKAMEKKVRMYGIPY